MNPAVAGMPTGVASDGNGPGPHRPKATVGGAMRYLVVAGL